MRAAQALRTLGRRAFHSSAAKQAADYEHRTHMYEPWNMKNRKLKMGLGVGACVGLGVAVPVIALELQFWKAKGGK